MSNNVTLSVCIPTYNSSIFLAETLDSLVGQFSDPDIAARVEITISDNDSSDDTFDVVRKYQEQYPNIQYNRNETNLGGAVNVIKVTENANGEYLWLLTDNDCSSSFSLKYILRIIDETHFDAMLGNFTISTPASLSAFQEEYKGYHKFQGISEFGEYLGSINDMPLHEFGSNFSLYSIFFAKKEYFCNARKAIDKDKLKTHFFPHSLIIYSQLEDKVIVKPSNIFTHAMGHPSSWKHSSNLFAHFHEVFKQFMYSKKITPGFKKKINRFLRGYFIINYGMMMIGPFPFVSNFLKKAVAQHSIVKKLIDKILNPSI